MSMREGDRSALLESLRSREVSWYAVLMDDKLQPDSGGRVGDRRYSTYRAALRADREVVLAAVAQNAGALFFAAEALRCDRECVLEAVELDGRTLEFASIELQGDGEVVRTAVQNYGDALGFAGEELRSDKDVVEAAVVHSGGAMRHAAEELRQDPDFVLKVVVQSPTAEALAFAAPELMLDREFVLAAVVQTGDALRYAPPELKCDCEVVSAAVAQNANAMKYAAEDLRADRDFMLTVTNQNSHALKFASDTVRGDRTVVLAAVARSGFALCYAAAELKRDREVVRVAVAQAAGSLRYAAVELQNDREVVSLAVSQSGNALRYASEALRQDRQVVLAAIAQTVDALHYASSELKKDREFVLAVVAQSGTALRHAAAELRQDREVVLAATAQDPNALQYAATELQQQLRGDRRQFLLTALQDGNACALQYATDGVNRDREVVLAAITQGGDALQFAATELQSDRVIVLAAVKNSSNALQYAATQLQHEYRADRRKFALAAVAQSGEAWAYVPNDLQLDDQVLTTAFAHGLRVLNIRNRGLGDVVVASVIEVAVSSSLTELDLAANNLSEVPSCLGQLTTLLSVDLSDNQISELPANLGQLTNLARLELGGNPQLESIDRIKAERGVPGVFEYLNDLADDPKPQYMLKVLLAGPTMAGKTSIARRLMGRAEGHVLAHAKDERTIGLDIHQGINLKDERGRAPEGIELVCYDSGGHDEYQEIHQIFHTKNSLYMLVWDLSKPPKEGQDMRSHEKQMIKQQVEWTMMIQSCAPGSTVLLVGSHADAVTPEAAATKCSAMAAAIHHTLREYGAKQQRELDDLQQRHRLNESAQQRLQHLQEVVRKPLRLSADAIAVSAKTKYGFDELQQRIVEAAFDKTAFPTFGDKVPGTYRAIVRKLERDPRLNRNPCLKWEDMERAAKQQTELMDATRPLKVSCVRSSLPTGFSQATGWRRPIALASGDGTDGTQPEPELEPEPETEAEIPVAQPKLVGTIQWEEALGDKQLKIELSRSGILALKDDSGTSVHPMLDLTKPGTQIDEPKQKRAGHIFCIRIDTVGPSQKLVMDMGNVEQHQRWLEALRDAASIQEMQAKPFRTYFFQVHTAEGEFLKEFAIRHRNASEAHKVLQSAGLVPSLEFPNRIVDMRKDFNNDEKNWKRREKEMEAYYQELFQNREVLSHDTFRTLFNFDFDELQERHSRVSRKVQADPDLIKRAMFFLGITGEVLCRQYDRRSSLASTLRSRVVLRPQWLVDVMKELVRHDLEYQLTINHPVVKMTEEIKELGLRFISTGILDGRLRPWIWRDLRPSVSDDEELMDFLVSLMEDHGLLTRLPGSYPPQWLLPMRLPERNVAFATAAAIGTFTRFLQRMASGHISQTDVVGLSAAITSIEQAQIISSDALRNGCKVAYEKADQILAGRTHDDNGLTKDQIAAINFYTQESMDPTNPYLKVNVYQKMNAALRSQEIEQIRPFWAYIGLLQSALLQLPPAVPALVYRGLNGPQPKILAEEERRKIRVAEPTYWWAFSSTSTRESTAREFAGGLPPTSLPKVMYTIESQGSQARDIMAYSHIRQENELLMPCGSAFAVQSVEEESGGLLAITLKQTEAVLLRDVTQGQEHRNQDLKRLAEILDGLDAQAATECVCYRFEFGQPLPRGLLAVVLITCSKLCGERVEFWRRHLSAILAADYLDTTQPDVDIPTQRCRLNLLKRQLKRGGIEDATLAAEIMQLEAAIASKVDTAATGLQVEISIGQEDPSTLVICARCDADGDADYRRYCRARLDTAVGRFQRELHAVIMERWPGCSLAEGDAEGPPPRFESELEPAPEPQLLTGS